MQSTVLLYQHPHLQYSGNREVSTAIVLACFTQGIELIAKGGADWSFSHPNVWRQASARCSPWCRSPPHTVHSSPILPSSCKSAGCPLLRCPLVLHVVLVSPISSWLLQRLWSIAWLILEEASCFEVSVIRAMQSSSKRTLGFGVGAGDGCRCFWGYLQLLVKCSSNMW